MDNPKPSIPPLTRRTYAMVLAGGRGSRLKELTDRRAKPAVFFGAKTRIVDFALSNVWNSGIRRMGVATQYKAHSLIQHLQRGWNFTRTERNECFDILPASQRMDKPHWYKGTADAVLQNLDIIDAHKPEYLLVLAGDHIYKMDYGVMIQQHVESGADVTVGCLEVPRRDASAFGVLKVASDERILEFVEKPKKPAAIPDQPDFALASMGIYVFNYHQAKEILLADADAADSSHDFGKDIIPWLVKEGYAVAHRFNISCVRSALEPQAYWRDVGTIDAFWEANIDLCAAAPALDIYDQNWPIWTNAQMMPPAKFVHNLSSRRGMAVSSVVSGGCVVSGGYVERSMMFSHSRVNSYALVRDSLLFPECDIGRGVRLSKCIVERGLQLPEGLVVGETPEEDARRFRRTEGGVVLITEPMLKQL